MNVNRFLQLGLAVFLLILSSCRVSHSCDGIYEGILPAADCPGIYMLLAVNGDKYELLEKYMLQPETYVTYGTVTHKGKLLNLDNGMELDFSDNSVRCRNVLLKRFSDQKELPEIYTTQLLKENLSGEDATLKLYEKQGKQYADFCFNEKKYTLKLNAENELTDEYVDSNCSLKLLPETQQLPLQKNVLFNNGTDAYMFTQLTPTPCLYTLVGEETSDVPSFLDAMYYNDGKQAFVKLIHTAPGYCYTLLQTEASAKTAVYTDGTVEWQLGNNQNGTLIINRKKYAYTEQK